MDSTIPTTQTLSILSHQISGLNIPQTIALLEKTFPGKTVFSTSFSIEDQVITHQIKESGAPVTIFTLDTGRLFAETYSVWNATNEKYGHVKAYYPDRNLLEDFVNTKGPNAFYESADLRKRCCQIRKVEPLKRALKDNAIWITGLRAEHSPERQDHAILEWDEGNKIIKYNPILHWNTEDVRKYINEFDVPYNVLHDRGFVSIGCAPCTRAIRPGESFRAGRWWWEDNSKKECGLHAN